MRPETKVTYLDGARFRVESCGHAITCDQPVENGGTDTGMTPPEFLLASLGSCAAYYALEYLRVRNIPAIGLTVTVTSEEGQKPARLTHFRIALSVPGLEDQRHRHGILRAAKSCLIHNTLLRTPTIDVELETKNAAADHRQHALAANN